MWVCYKRDGTIAGANGTLQLDTDGIPRLLPVDDGNETYLMPQVEIPDAEYWEWKKSRPVPVPGKSLEERVAALESKLNGKDAR